MAAAQLICEHAQELRKKEVDYFAHHYTAPAAAVEARIAYNQTRQGGDSIIKSPPGGHLYPIYIDSLCTNSIIFYYVGFKSWKRFS